MSEKDASTVAATTSKMGALTVAATKSEKDASTVAATTSKMEELTVAATTSKMEELTVAATKSEKVTVTVVIHFNKDLIILPMKDVDFAEIKERVRDVFKLEYFEITMIYFDAEKDELYLTSEDELETALAVEEYHTLCTTSEVTKENTVIPQDISTEPILKLTVKIDLFFAESPEFKIKTIRNTNQEFRSLKIEHIEHTLSKLDEATKDLHAAMERLEKGKKTRKKVKKINKKLESLSQLREKVTSVWETLNSLMEKNQIVQKYSRVQTCGPSLSLFTPHCSLTRRIRLHNLAKK